MMKWNQMPCMHGASNCLTKKTTFSFLFLSMNTENQLPESNLLFREAFDRYIKGQVVKGWGFQQPKRVKMRDENFAFPCGYYTTYENGYQLIISGESLGTTPMQEAMILNPDGHPIARDTEDIRDVEF